MAGVNVRKREVAEDKSGKEGQGQRKGLLTLTNKDVFG